MSLARYPIVSSRDHRVYEFLSEGQNGTIRKVAYFQEIENNLFNLAFGDWNILAQRIDDRVRNNNNDCDKILATVAAIMIDLLKYHPRAEIFEKGITPARTRLYQIGIFAHWHEITRLLIVNGFINDQWKFVKKQKNYEAFLCRLRKKYSFNNSKKEVEMKATVRKKGKTEGITIAKKMRDYSNDPVFKKQLENARKFLKKHGLPKTFGKKD